MCFLGVFVGEAEQNVFLLHHLDPSPGLSFNILYLFSYLFIYLFFFCFLGPQGWHMEVPRLGVESELQPLIYATATATWMGSLTH